MNLDNSFQIGHYYESEMYINVTQNQYHKGFVVVSTVYPLLPLKCLVSSIYKVYMISFLVLDVVFPLVHGFFDKKILT